MIALPPVASNMPIKHSPYVPLSPQQPIPFSDVQSYLYTLEFKNGEKLEDFHRIILILQQDINIFG